MLNLPLPHRFHSIKQPVESLDQLQRAALENFREKLANGAYEFESAQCVCGERDGILIASRDRYALEVQTYLCKNCATMWTNPRMTSGSLGKFYSEDYRPIYVGQIQAPDTFFYDQVAHGRVILRFVEIHMPAPPLTIFDVGCGAGGVLLPFAHAGWHGFGCDLGHEYLQRGRSAGLVLEQGEAEVLAQYGSADLVILSHVLEHLPDPLSSLQRLSSLLKDRGFIYVELPGIFNIHRAYKDTMLFLQNAHLYHFTLTTLTSLMARAGFRLIQGDEFIHALFQRTDQALPVIDTSQQTRKLVAYLQMVEVLRRSRVLHLQEGALRLASRAARSMLGNHAVDRLMGRSS